MADLEDPSDVMMDGIAIEECHREEGKELGFTLVCKKPCKEEEKGMAAIFVCLKRTLMAWESRGLLDECVSRTLSLSL